MEHTDYRLAAVLFTDIVGFSRMMEEDEKGTLKTLDFHDALVREQITRHRGSVIKTIGDAFLAQFSTTLDAVSCALDIQAQIQTYNEAGQGKPLTLRIGVHMGDIYFYENDALGEGINIASRLQSITKPGRITISREVFSQVSGKIPMRVESLGQVQLKNISREVHAYEIIPGGEDNNSGEFLKNRRETTAIPSAPPPPSTPEEKRPPTPSTEGNSDRPTSGPPPSFRDLKDEWKSLKDRIKQEIQENLDDEDWRHSWKQKRREMRARYRGRRNWGTGDEPADQTGGGEVSAFRSYKERELKNLADHSAGVRSHLTAYIAVNVGLYFLWSMTGGGFPWYLFVLGGWGIGTLSHLAAFFAGRKSTRELKTLDDLNDQDFKTLKKHQQARTGFWSHLASNTGVGLFLLMIWSVLGGGFPWPFIVIGAMGIGVLSHWGGYAAKKRQFKDFWKALKSGKPTSAGIGSAPAEDPAVVKARQLRDSIVAQANGMKGGNPFGEDMSLTLDNYVKQIGELSAIEKEIASVVRSFNPAELEEEAAELQTKRDKAGSETLRQEYAKSLAEVEKQAKSYHDLSEQQEILSLRLGSALKNLQQMQIDLARIKSLSDGQKDGYFVTLKDRSQELSRYIEDYREGLQEIPR